MAIESQNIYKNARKSAGFTQEKASQLLNVSVDSLRDYEQSQRPVPSDVASAMCDVYQAPYLAVQHLRLTSDLGKRVVPEIQLKDLPEAVLGVLAAVQRFCAKREAMVEIAASRMGRNHVLGQRPECGNEQYAFFERRTAVVSKESYFIGCAEVAELVGCGKSRAYKYIQQMNRELEARGNLTFPGRVPRRYAMERFGLLGEVQEDESTNARAAGSGGSGAASGGRKHRRGVRFPAEAAG